MIRRIHRAARDRPRSRPEARCVHQLFESQAARTPDAVALVFEDETLSYRQLDERAGRLALHLRGLGAGPDVLVGICAERSLELIVGLLAILKAGAAYVPLEPSLPPERLAFIIQDTAPRVILVQSRLTRVLPPHPAAVVSLEDSRPAGDPPPRPASPEDLAYVLFTSGSTGTPKGVCVPHRAVVRLVRNARYARLAPEERFLQLAPMGFDASTFEIWAPLLNGATLVIFPPGAASLAGLGSFILEYRVTTLWLTAGLFHQMVDNQSANLKNLRQLLAGGDVLSVAHAAKALERLPDCRLMNCYGPTENTTFTCCHRITRADVQGSSIPIGRPINNTTALILDERMRPVPVGEPGELHTGGAGLARGYLNRPDLTSEKFIPNPFTRRPGDRLYKTGDRCRMRADGIIEFLGRIDAQVKIRGFRVEPGEIEAALQRHPGVAQAMVTTRPDATGDKQLIACFVPARRKPVPENEELISFLRQKLPAPMIPAAFVALNSLPLTRNGKFDRQALRPPEQPYARGDRASTAPRTPVEEALAGFWAEALGLKRIGVHDNFFDLGGHSLMALVVQNRIEKVFGAKLSLAAFFQNPTVAGLAKLADPALAGRPFHPVFLAQSSGDKPPLFFLHYPPMTRQLGRHIGNDRKIYGVGEADYELAPWGGDGSTLVTIKELAARDAAIIQSLQPNGPYHLAGFCFGGTVACEVASQLGHKGGQVVSLSIIEAVYEPGCKPFGKRGLAINWAGLALYHARQIQKRGLTYLSRRISQKATSLTQSLLRWAAAQTKAARIAPPPETIGLEILKRHTATPYHGSALLVRAGARAHSWTLDTRPAYGWDKLILGKLQIEDLRCAHSEINEESNLIKLAEILRHHLAAMDLNAKMETLAPAGGQAQGCRHSPAQSSAPPLSAAPS